jgi:hypothetical protein
MQRFFSGAETFDFFKGNQVFQTSPAEFLRENKANRSGQLSLATIYFLSAPKPLHPKNCREIPPGGGTMTASFERTK